MRPFEPSRDAVNSGLGVFGGGFRAEVELYEEEGWRANASKQLREDTQITPTYAEGEHPFTSLDRHQRSLGMGDA